MNFRTAFALFLGLLPVTSRAVSITFDYSLDSNSFFTSHPTARTDLEAAASFYDSLLTDTLQSIAPGGPNSWTAIFFNPSTGANQNVSNLTIATNEIHIFVGANTLSSGTLGLGGPGGFSSSGSQAFLNTVAARGQTGALSSSATDFGPWGGSIQFSLTANWYFDSDPATLESFSGQSDFYSVALHELGHLLGLGTADSWNSQISGGFFTGAASEASHGGPVPLDGSEAHWASGTASTVYGSGIAQETAMDPSLTTGTRKLFTDLDVAGLSDIGWTIAVPEPASVALLVFGGAVLIPLRRRNQSSSPSPAPFL